MRIALLLAGAACLVWACALSANSNGIEGSGGAAADHREGTNAGNASRQVTQQR